MFEQVEGLIGLLGGDFKTWEISVFVDENLRGVSFVFCKNKKFVLINNVITMKNLHFPLPPSGL